MVVIQQGSEGLDDEKFESAQVQQATMGGSSPHLGEFL